MPENFPARAGGFRALWERTSTFVKRDLWLRLPDRRGPRFLYRMLRMGVLIVEGFIESDVFMLSAALTYQVIFALVPLLVVMLAFVKAVGGLSNVGEQVQTFLLSHILPKVGTVGADGTSTGTDLSKEINSFINNVNAAAIGVVGSIALLYTSLSLLASIEKVINRIWGIKASRTILRRLTVYWTFLTASPVLLAASLSMTGVVQSNRLYLWLTTHVPYFGKATLLLTPYLVAWVLFTGFYIFMPNTRVHPGAALMGALISGTAWEGMKTVYFWYNAHVLTNYKFYGSLGTIPVFLLWVYLSWIIVLFGAEVAFAAQHVNTYRREIEHKRFSGADRERLALVVSVEVVRPFIQGNRPPAGDEVAERLESPVRIVNEILYELSAQGVLRAVTLPDRKDPGYLPARDPALLTARDVLRAIRGFGDGARLPTGPGTDDLYRLVDRAEAQAMGPLGEVALRDLALRQAAPGEPRSTEAQGGAGAAKRGPAEPGPSPSPGNSTA